MKTLLAALLLLLLQASDLESLRKKYDEEKDRPYAERIQTLSKIGGLKTDAAAEFLETVHDTDKNDSVRSYALTALGTCGTERALKKLNAVARDEAAPYASRSAALTALARTRSKEVLDLIVSIFKDTKSALRIAACTALQQYPLKDTESLWREALADGNATLRMYAFRALAPLKDPRVLEAARKAIEDPKETSTVKAAAVEPWKAAGGADAVPVLLTAAAGDDATIRKAVLEAFASLADEKAIEALYAGLGHASRICRALVARSLGKIKHDKAMEKLLEALKDRDADVRAAALEAIAERRDAKSEETLLREAQKGEDEASLTAIGLLPAYPSKAVADFLVKLAGSAKKLSVHVAALDALGDLKSPDALPVFDKAIKHKEWQVRAAAIRGLSKLKVKESIDLLIERMAREEGRLLVDLAEALKLLTGKALGYAQGHWKDWWNANRETFVFAEKAEGVGGAAGTTTYHGVPVLSKRIIFCLDMSGSMSAMAGGENRLEQAKKELVKVLGQLGKDVTVNLIFFDDKFEAWQKQLVPIVPNLEKAKAVIKELKPRGGTNIYDPLEKAFEDTQVDTIFLLSDGAPGSGKFVNTDDILREIRKLNRSRQITIHTISLGASAFMKQLADQNGGQYVEKK